MIASRNQPVRLLIVGAGRMGCAHAQAYARISDFRVVGVVNRGAERRLALSHNLGGVAEFSDLAIALEQLRPDGVCIATYPNTHVDQALLALQAGAHVFVEKPMAQDVAGARHVLEFAEQAGLVVFVGYILRVHPAWQKFVLAGRALGTPLVMRFSLNQQSDGEFWQTHRRLLRSASPVVDSGVHYLDVMCQLTQARPIRVAGVGARLCPDTPQGQFDYGQLQVTFADGSVGWFEAGWGPAMSRDASFVRDVIGPLGSASLRTSSKGELELLCHRSALDEAGHFQQPDEVIPLNDAELDLDALCELQANLWLRAIRGGGAIGDNQRAAVDCLRIALAADEAMRTGRVVELDA